MSRNKRNFMFSGILFLLFIIFTVVVKIVDVHSIGPEGSLVGLATINNSFKDVLPLNETIYKVSEILGYISLLIVAMYGIIGIKQLIERKSIFKVDRNILLLGMFYILVAIVYVIFEFVVINYRPVLLDGLEASYPSSHTVLSICVCISSVIVSKSVLGDKKFVKVFNILSIILMVLIVLTRFLSGVHWLTDILGGILISLALCTLFEAFVNIGNKKTKIDIKI